MDIDIQREDHERGHAWYPLGLLINEIISNSFKYAFAGRQQGTIIVHLDGNEQVMVCFMRVGDDGVGLKSRDRDSNARTAWAWT
jgi:two-component sensor histidine kinase